jgi:two-component system OmpR family response regulator
MARILVVEQDTVLLNLISSALRQDGYSVIETTDSMRALAIAAEHAEALDLFLTDVEMEPISGFEIVKRLILNKIDIPAQFNSGFHGIAGVIASTYGEHAVIEKPFTASELCEGVARFLTKCRRRPNVGKELGIEAA